MLSIRDVWCVCGMCISYVYILNLLNENREMNERTNKWTNKNRTTTKHKQITESYQRLGWTGSLFNVRFIILYVCLFLFFVFFFRFEKESGLVLRCANFHGKWLYLLIFVLVNGKKRTEKKSREKEKNKKNSLNRLLWYWWLIFYIFSKLKWKSLNNNKRNCLH